MHDDHLLRDLCRQRGLKAIQSYAEQSWPELKPHKRMVSGCLLQPPEGACSRLEMDAFDADDAGSRGIFQHLSDVSRDMLGVLDISDRVVTSQLAPPSF